MAQTLLGIDIGSYSVKVCRFNRQFSHVEVTDFYEQKISQSARLSPEEATSAAIKTLLDKHNLEADLVACGLPSQLVSFRIIELPFTNIKKIEQTIEFELESFIPISIDDLVMDYHILSQEGGRSSILVAYIPRSRLIKNLDLLQNVNVDPKYLGINAIDLSHVSLISMVPQDAVYVILDIGHQSTNLCVMEGMQLRYVRSFSVGGVHFTRAIQKAFRLSYEKAEGLKLDRGKVSFNDDNLDQISSICQEVAEELIVAIRQTHIGYREMYHDKEWMAIFLTGGGARMSGLPELISNSLKVNVSHLDCLDFFPHKLGQPELFRDIICGSLAQALKVIHSNKSIKINFRRGEFSYRKDFQALGSEIKQLGLWVILVLFLAIGNFSAAKFRIEAQLGKTDEVLIESAIKAMPELKSQKSKTSKKLLKIINSKISELGPQVEAFKESENGLSPLSVFLELSKVLPKKAEVKLDIDDFVFNADQVILTGTTDSYEAIDKIEESLSKSSLFENINRRKGVRSFRDQIQFTLAMDITETE